MGLIAKRILMFFCVKLECFVQRTNFWPTLNCVRLIMGVIPERTTQTLFVQNFC